MHRKVFEAAVEASVTKRGDGLLRQSLKHCCDIANCIAAVLMVQRDGEAEIIASYGVSAYTLPQFVETHSALADAWATYGEFEDTRQNKLTNNHTFFVGDQGMDYAVNVPIVIPGLNLTVSVLCGDARTDQDRGENLRERLESAVGVIEGVLAQTGELALAVDRLAQVRTQVGTLVATGSKSEERVVFLDSDFRVVNASEGFRQASAEWFAGHEGSELSKYFVKDSDAIDALLSSMLDDNDLVRTTEVTSPQDGHRVLLIVIRIIGGGLNQPCFGCYLMPIGGSDEPRFAQSALTNRVCEQVPSIPEEPSVTSDFLLDTLVDRQRVLVRSDIAYHALVKWRASIKPIQIAALHALKKAPPPRLVDSVAGHLIEAVDRLWDRDAIEDITSVACGHSGRDCFSSVLARRIAQLLDRDYIQAFDDLAVTGKSHPRKNAKRPHMKLRANPDRPVLLIDDVATSGSHIAEATRLLRSRSPLVFPLVWIAA